MSSGSSRREPDGEGRPLTGLAGDLDLATLGSDQRFGNRQAQAGVAIDLAGPVASVKPVKDQGQVFGCDPRARVAHREQHESLRFMGAAKHNQPLRRFDQAAHGIQRFLAAPCRDDPP
jgi:hypothetical protein